MKEYIKSIIGKYSTIIKNTGYLFILEFIRLTLPLLAITYIIRTVGATKYGTIIFAQTIIYYFSVFVNWGFDISAVKDVALNKNNHYELITIFNNVIFTKIFLFFIASVILVIMCLIIPYCRENWILFTFAFITTFSDILIAVWFYQGVEEMKFITLCKAGSVIVYALCIFLFIKESNDYILVPFFQSLGNLIAAVVSVYVIIKKFNIRIIKVSAKNIKKYLSTSFPFFLSRLSAILNNSIAKTICGITSNMEMVGIYDIAQKIATISNVPIQMLNQAIYPHIAKTLDKKFVNNFYNIILIVSLLVALALFILAPIAVLLVSGQNLEDATTILKILCLWVFFCGLSSYIGTPVLISFGHQREFNLSVVISSIFLVMVFSIYVFFNVKILSLYAIAIVCSEIIIYVYRIYNAKKYKIIGIK